MAVYRQLHTSFWQDAFVLTLTPEEKYFYIYLLTNSKTKQCGIYELPIRIAEMETGYNRETIEKLIKKFVAMEKIVFNDETNEIVLLNWLKYNPDNNPKIKACINKELVSVKDKSLLSLLGYENTHGTYFSKNARVSDGMRDFIFEQYGNKCHKCGKTENLTIDHIIPRSMGGTSIPDNLRCLCRSCNSSRPVAGKEMIDEITKDGFDYEGLCQLMEIKRHQYPIRGQSQKEKEKEKEEEEEKEVKNRPKTKFSAPTIREVEALFQDKEVPEEAERFFNYYESNGWKVGKNPMKNWKAAAANWIKNLDRYGTNQKQPAKIGRNDYAAAAAQYNFECFGDTPAGEIFGIAGRR